MRTARNFFQSELYRSLVGKSRPKRGRIIEDFVRQRELSLGDLRNEIGFLDSDWNKEKLVFEWFEKEPGIRTLEDFEFALSFFPDYDERQHLLTRVWLLSNEERTLADLQGALGLFNNDRRGSDLAQNWLNKEGRTLADLQGVLDLFADEQQKSNLARTWLDKDGRTLEDLQGVLDLFAYFQQKSDISQTWLNKETNPDTKCDKLVLLAQSGAFCTPYDIRKIVSMYSAVNLPADKIGGFCKDLYPLNENLQTETFGEFMRVISPQSLSEAKQNLASFVKSLNSDDYALQALNALKTKIGLTPLEVLEISKDRLSEKYQSLAETLKSKRANSSLIEAGVAVVANEFRRELSDEITLADLFSYYDSMRDGLAIFKSIIKPEIFQEMRANFAPSASKAYIGIREFEKLEPLFNDEASPELNLDLPKVKVLSDYLSGRVGTPICTQTKSRDINLESLRF